MVIASNQTLRVLSSVTSAEEHYRGPMERSEPPAYDVKAAAVSGLYAPHPKEDDDHGDCNHNEGLEHKVNSVARYGEDTDEC